MLPSILNSWLYKESSSLYERANTKYSKSVIWTSLQKNPNILTFTFHKSNNKVLIFKFH